MVQLMLKKLFKIAIYLIFIVANHQSYSWSGQKQSEGLINDNIRFSQKLNLINVEDLKINGMYQNIPFYVIPDDKNKDPKDNSVLLNLAPIDSNKPFVEEIEPVTKINKGSKRELKTEKYKNIEYITVKVKFSTGEIRNYLLDGDTYISAIDKKLKSMEYKMKVTELQKIEITKEIIVPIAEKKIQEFEDFENGQ
jgi:hypothetical protein